MSSRSVEPGNAQSGAAAGAATARCPLSAAAKKGSSGKSSGGRDAALGAHAQECERDVDPPGAADCRSPVDQDRVVSSEADVAAHAEAEKRLGVGGDPFPA